MLGKYPVERVSGGVAVHTINLIHSLGKIDTADLDFSIVSYGRDTRVFKDGNATIRMMKIHMIYYLFPPLSILRIAHEVRKVKPSVIHVQGSNLTPYLVYALFFSPGVKKIITFHGDELKEKITVGQVRDNSVRFHAYKWLEKTVLTNFDMVVCVSAYLKRSIISEYGEDLAKKIIVIPNGADLVNFIPRPKSEERRKLRIPGDDYVIFHAKSMDVNHGQMQLIRAVSIVKEKIPGIRLILAGDGPNRQNIINLIEELGLANNVVLLGDIQNRQIPQYIASSDIICIPTLSMYGIEEPSCIFLLEGMAMEKPCIVPESGGFPESVTDYVNGLLIPRVEPDIIAARVLELHDNPALANELGKNARSYVKKERTWDEVAKKLAEYYHGLAPARVLAPAKVIE